MTHDAPGADQPRTRPCPPDTAPAWRA